MQKCSCLTRGASIAARMSMPQSTFRRDCIMDGKIKDPPEPPSDRKNVPSSWVTIVGAVEDSGRFPGAG